MSDIIRRLQEDDGLLTSRNEMTVTIDQSVIRFISYQVKGNHYQVGLKINRISQIKRELDVLRNQLHQPSDTETFHANVSLYELIEKFSRDDQSVIAFYTGERDLPSLISQIAFELILYDIEKEMKKSENKVKSSSISKRHLMVV
jgi:hypothetical protein